MSQAAPEPPKRLADLLFYAAMAVPLAFAGLPIYLHAPDFYSRELGVPLASLGTALLALRIIGAVQDPLIGHCGDRFSVWRGPVIAFGAIMLMLGLWMMFHPVRSFALVWFCVSVFLCTSGFSIVSINFQTLGGLWRATANQRTRITAWREALGLVGLLAGAVLPALLGSAENPATAFHQLTLIYLPLIVIATWLLLRWMRHTPLDQADDTRPAGTWRSVAASPWRRHFFGIYALNSLANACPAVLVIFFIRDKLQAETDTGLFLLLYFLSGALAMPLWQRVSGVIGKYRCWSLSILLAVVTFFWALFLGPGDWLTYGAICMLSGIALGADLALPPSMLADHIAHETAQSSAASYFSIMTFIAKASLALATGLLLPALAMAGFQPGRAPSPQAALYLGLAYALVPCLIKLVVVIWLRQQHQLLQSAGNN